MAGLGAIDLSSRTVEELEHMAVLAADSTAWQTWEALRELAVGRMRDESQDIETRLRWVRLGMTACRRKSASSGFDPVKSLADEVNLRVYAIREFGPLPGDEMRDAAQLCETVYQGIGKSREELSAESVDWRTLPKERMLRLRYAKNLLTPLQRIVDVLPSDAPVRGELSAWLPLIPRLP
ncbi:hypothetical protein ACWDO7_12775 [Streptomyces sp. NPDC003656]